MLINVQPMLLHNQSGDSNEKGYGYDVEFALEHFVAGKNLLVGAGAGYTVYQQSSIEQTVFDGAHGEYVEESQFSQSMNYVNLPLYIKGRSNILGKRTKLYAQAGVSPQYLINADITSVEENTGLKIRTNTAVNNWYVPFKVQVGAEINLAGCSTMAVGVGYQNALSTQYAPSDSFGLRGYFANFSFIL
ncbi:MAG: hypothetical protein R2798_06180 [Chitinophagales bacterium]